MFSLVSYLHSFLAFQCFAIYFAFTHQGNAAAHASKSD
jgi:hypothetical protein